jgi:hypothetical protein
LSLQVISNIPYAIQQINDSDWPEYFLFKLMRSKGILNDAKRAKPLLTGLLLKFPTVNATTTEGRSQL